MDIPGDPKISQSMALKRARQSDELGSSDTDSSSRENDTSAEDVVLEPLESFPPPLGLPQSSFDFYPSSQPTSSSSSQSSRGAPRKQLY